MAAPGLPAAAGGGLGAARGRCARGPRPFGCRAACSARRWKARPARLLRGGRPGGGPQPRPAAAGEQAAAAPPPEALLRRILGARTLQGVTLGEVEEALALRGEPPPLVPAAAERPPSGADARCLGAAADAQTLAVRGCLLFVRGLLMQDQDNYTEAFAAFSSARPLLEAAVRGGLAADLDEPARRFLTTCLAFTGELGRALALGEEGVRRYGSAGLLRLVGELSSVQGSRLGEAAAVAGQRAAAFRRAKEALEAADRLEPGHKRVYTGWAFALVMLEDVEGCRQVAERAIAHCKGFWVDAMQRPNHMVPGLVSKPWHDPADFGWIRRLEAGWRGVLSELEALERAGAGGSAWPEVRGHDRSLAGATGVWREYPLLGLREEAEVEARRCCPVTCGLLAEVEAVRAHRELRSKEETALFSRLTPGTRLRPHCGPTNTHLTCHLGLRVPEGCEIRVGHESRRWQEGKCLVFDDSYEHEVWHRGDSTRVVLLIRFWHPGIAPAQREAILRAEARERISKAWTLL